VVVHPADAGGTRHYPPADFGPWLKARRLASGLSFRQAARLIGTSTGYVDLLEKSRRCPSRSFAYELARAYRLVGADLDRMLDVCVDGHGRDFVKPE
jgi:transcriptional regulator with XRE-family HTH domain